MLRDFLQSAQIRRERKDYYTTLERVVATENSHVSDEGGIMTVVVGWDVRNDATSYSCTMSFDQTNRLTGATYAVSGSF